MKSFILIKLLHYNPVKTFIGIYIIKNTNIRRIFTFLPTSLIGALFTHLLLLFASEMYSLCERLIKVYKPKLHVLRF